ncbi:hypothetical protein FE257_012886 [Aspergillus nanangensis]|uniref:CENP-C homolog n=1 Tax=Aspergillus nanangensis TaxID=2582783 RepID=A0AAD4CFE6_ASPNN|nr:hypothetical protein FE257_012886 [Aspergillus nanangensis]
MAPRGPAKTRDNDYSNVGKAGRRTGITVKEAERDEHGMEDIDGMWSSPEKSPVEGNEFYGRNDDSTGSDGMSMDEGNAPGPADFLNGANSRRGSFFPPPVARSPMKTGLTGSPRRTPGLRSSHSPQRDLLSSSPSDGKGLRSAKGESRYDISPLTSRPINAASLNQVRPKGSGKNPEPFSESEMNGDENGNSFEQTQDDFLDSFAAGDDTTSADQLDDHEPAADSSSPIISNSRQQKQPNPTSKAKLNNVGQSRQVRDSVELGDDEFQELPAKRKRAGRPPKSQVNNSDDTEERRQSKKPKTSKKPARDLGELDPELDKVVEDYANRTGPLKGRSLYILKREAPSDNSSTHTRSGRVSVRPLAYWRNERCVFGDGEAAEGQRYPLSTIKEVIRTEELEPEKRKGNKRRSSKKSKTRGKVDESDSEDYVDPWEKDGGVLHGYIRKWDPEIQTGADEEEVLDIAFAPMGMETRAVKGSSFRFAKLLSSPFLGSGIVELPPGGVKKPKNSKKMHMVFYVCQGRVQVDVSGVQFSAGKGCVFQVPRGNYYSFANTFGKDARLFFTQGCVPTENDISVPGSASKQDMMEGEGESIMESAEPVRATGTTGKGRPKGKQKAGPKSKSSK